MRCEHKRIIVKTIVFDNIFSHASFKIASDRDNELNAVLFFKTRALQNLRNRSKVIESDISRKDVSMCFER